MFCSLAAIDRSESIKVQNDDNEEKKTDTEKNIKDPKNKQGNLFGGI